MDDKVMEAKLAWNSSSIVQCKSITTWGGIAQRKHSWFSPSSPGFDSWRSQEFFQILDVAEINRGHFLECGKAWIRRLSHQGLVVGTLVLQKASLHDFCIDPRLEWVKTRVLHFLEGPVQGNSAETQRCKSPEPGRIQTHNLLITRWALNHSAMIVAPLYKIYSMLKIQLPKWTPSHCWVNPGREDRPRQQGVDMPNWLSICL